MQCRICGASSLMESVQYRNRGRHKHEIFEGLSVLACGRCESSWAENPPDNEALADYYTERYKPVGTGDFKNDPVWPIWDSRPASLITLGRLFVEFKAGDLFIDVGPGNGAALSLARYLLPNPRIACVEYNRQSIQVFRRHCPDIAVATSLESLLTEFGEGSTKMIYSAHCLEHFGVDDLERQLNVTRRVLCSDGIFALEVPHAAVERMKTSNHSPHLLFFTIMGLQQLLIRTGFQVRLCFTAAGRSRRGREHVKRLLPAPSKEVVGEAIADNIALLNVPDFVPKFPRGAESAVIKCFASKV